MVPSSSSTRKYYRNTNKLLKDIIKCFWWFAPFGYLYFSYFSTNEPELGARIDSGMA
jgi:hypothetical protein